MKRKLGKLLMMLLALCIFTLTSCHKTDHRFMGKWKITQATAMITIEKEAYDETYSIDITKTLESITFKDYRMCTVTGYKGDIDEHGMLTVQDSATTVEGTWGATDRYQIMSISLYEEAGVGASFTIDDMNHDKAELTTREHFEIAPGASIKCNIKLIRDRS